MANTLSAQLNRALGASLDPPAPNFRFVVRFPSLTEGEKQASNPDGFLSSRFQSSSLEKILKKAGDWYTDTFQPEAVIAESFSFSPQQPSAQSRFFGGGERVFPTFTTIDAVTCTIYETVDYKATEYFNTWRNLVVDSEHNYNEPKYYKKTVTLYVFDWVQSTKEVLRVEVKDCWPSNTSGYEYSYEDDGRLKLQVQFSVDTMGINIEKSAHSGVEAGNDIANIALSSIGLR